MADFGFETQTQDILVDESVLSSSKTLLKTGDVVAIAVKRQAKLAYVVEDEKDCIVKVLPLREMDGYWARAGKQCEHCVSLVVKIPNPSITIRL